MIRGYFSRFLLLVVVSVVSLGVLYLYLVDLPPKNDDPTEDAKIGVLVFLVVSSLVAATMVRPDDDDPATDP